MQKNTKPRIGIEPMTLGLRNPRTTNCAIAAGKPPAGIEPTTFPLLEEHSTTELWRLFLFNPTVFFGLTQRAHHQIR